MKALLFTKRNIKEMLRDPLVYIFCVGFPIAMVLLFQIILHYTPDNSKTTIFEVKSLIPGIMVFSYSILMLMSSLLISKDKSTAFLKRLYTSPMKGKDYIIGYFIPFFVIGILQSIICIILGYIFGATSNTGFILYLLLILFFGYFYTFLIMNPSEMSKTKNDPSADGSILLGRNVVINPLGCPC